MGKTIDNIVNFVKEVKDSATPRENFGIEGYQAFINETREIDSSIIENQMAYNKNMAESDRVYNGELQEELDLKKDVALYRANRVGELRVESEKYLSKLSKISEDYHQGILNIEPEITEGERNLRILKEQYIDAKDLVNISKENKLSNWDKAKNILYSVFYLSKIKKDTETELEMEVRSECENEANLLKNEIEFHKRILNGNVKQSKEYRKKENLANREISKIFDFNSRTNEMQSFYEKYLYNFSSFEDSILKINEA